MVLRRQALYQYGSHDSFSYHNLNSISTFNFVISESLERDIQNNGFIFWEMTEFADLAIKAELCPQRQVSF